MIFVCLDVEGVLLPEVWIEIAQATGVDELKLTTRDEPDFSLLMQHRIQTLRSRKIAYHDLKEIVCSVEPLSGAREFLDELRSSWPVALVSDSFYEFLGPLAPKLGLPSIFCHNLTVGDDGYLSGWKARLDDQKPKVVAAMQSLGFTVLAAGDSFNDLGMLEKADFGAFINAPEHIRQRFPNRESYDNLRDLKSAFQAQTIVKSLS
ncbi:bifunctional phosphoserine phosphatase/homoserine phosphotransferase ThrH (plasmid) [Deefgea piscis]|uniref:phosphoserine phosphatase n=1 Tax=Deefgea piscis TaxID=2739061 RepID=A0A6M8SSX4_9NEIS|nr:bifunctional phosphoserine phosphatase/homoserine phosphotransferase ThrH [Deefgea piscis]QKJ68285.1 bifunctional phosphoserine phosphatase/homoserine phosphotransferase ThrH [Deefgea piscis]